MAGFWLTLLGALAILAWSVARAWPRWSLYRLRAQATPSRAPGGPYRGAVDELPPLQVRELDRQALRAFALQLGVSVAAMFGLGVSLAAFVAFVSGGGPAGWQIGLEVGALGAVLAALLAVPMWLEQPRLHLLLAVTGLLFGFGLWPPAVLFLGLQARVQAGLLRRRVAERVQAETETETEAELVTDD